MQLSEAQRAHLDREWDKVRGSIAQCNAMIRYGEDEPWMPAIVQISNTHNFLDPRGLAVAMPTEFRLRTPAEIEAELKADGRVYLDWRANHGTS